LSTAVDARVHRGRRRARLSPREISSVIGVATIGVRSSISHG